MTVDPEIMKILSIDHADPREGFAIMLTDFTKRMQVRGLSQNIISGMQLALRISYRLGERAGIQSAIEAIKEEAKQPQ